MISKSGIYIYLSIVIQPKFSNNSRTFREFARVKIHGPAASVGKTRSRSCVSTLTSASLAAVGVTLSLKI